jgi:trans-L-3-hydroxyproline dehydratase
MYGGFLTDPVTPDGDFGILFMHNEGFSTMCGHGVIAVTTSVLDTGMLPVDRPETRVRIDSPAGPITAFAELDGNRVAAVRFENVTSFVSELDASVEVPEFGEVRYDLAFGGAFYAYVDATALSLSLEPSSGAELAAAGRAIKHAVSASRDITHPDDDDLGFLYGVIFVGPASDPAHHSRNVCVFADGEIDRSPTGTGVCGRVAIDHARGEVAVGETIAIESIVGSVFEATVDRVVDGGVVPVVRGRAHVTGRHQFWIDPSDRQPPFVVR